MLVLPVSLHTDAAGDREARYTERADSAYVKFKNKYLQKVAFHRFLCSTMFSNLAFVLLPAVAASAIAAGATETNITHLHYHDSGFTPDFYLRVTYENHTVACQHRMSVLVNGTSPGPPLRLPPGKTSWVRVCNDMDAYNTTMVAQTLAMTCRTDS